MNKGFDILRINYEYDFEIHNTRDLNNKGSHKKGIKRNRLH